MRPDCCIGTHVTASGSSHIGRLISSFQRAAQPLRSPKHLKRHAASIHAILRFADGPGFDPKVLLKRRVIAGLR